MKKYITLLLLCLPFLSVKSQILQTKLKIHASYGISKSLTGKEINDNSFITPSFFSNFENVSNTECGAKVFMTPIFSIGTRLKNTKFSDWNYSGENKLYKDSKAQIKSFAPELCLHTSFRETGFFNKFQASVIVAPSYNFVKADFGNTIYEVYPYIFDNPLKSTSFSSFGCDISAQCEYAPVQQAGLFFNIGLLYFKTESVFFNDKNNRFFNYNFGLYFRFIKDKHFYYGY
jgi:hypothetical protein